MESYTGTIIPWGSDRIPSGWKVCDGSTLEISKYQALSSLLGQYYGGDGKTTFNLPDLRGRVAIGTGSIDPGSKYYKLGERGGYEKVNLTKSQIPNHIHLLKGNKNTTTAKVPLPTDNVLGTPQSDYCMYTNTSTNTKMHEESIGNSGSGVDHENMQPFTVMHYIICVNGIYPTRS